VQDGDPRRGGMALGLATAQERDPHPACERGAGARRADDSCPAHEEYVHRVGCGAATGPEAHLSFSILLGERPPL
jgi:hypothetical protein